MSLFTNFISNLKYHYVKTIYGDHNNAKVVKETLSKLLSSLPADAKGLNIGAGKSKIDSRISNLEMEAGEGIDIVGSVESIPCPDNCFDFVITQEVLEHVKSPFTAIQEIYRVLKPGGTAYIQLPFVIGFHPCPADYWRFTQEGIVALTETTNLKIIETKMSTGPAVGFYRIFVEFASILFSFNTQFLYMLSKAFFSLIFYPIKWLDPILSKTKQAKRIAGGYFVLCEKVKRP
jgi:SAM-dependent methyltransferase